MQLQTQFKKGNYDEWYRICTEKAPAVNRTVRHGIIPALESKLTAMVGAYSSIEKDSISMSFRSEGDALSGLVCRITYLVDDFHVANVPQDAVDEDRKAIQEALGADGYTVESVEIDTNTGMLSIEVAFGFGDSDDEA